MSLISLLLALAGAAGAQGFLNLPERELPAERATAELAALPRGALYELRLLHEKYSAMVRRRVEDGWSYGVLPSEIVVQRKEKVIPARQLEEGLSTRKKELARLEAAVKGSKERREALAPELEAARTQARVWGRHARRARGHFVDWSDAVFLELQQLEPQYWALDEALRKAPPRHGATVGCAPLEKPTICLAFDPWGAGRAEIYEFYSWDRGSDAGRLPQEFMLNELPGSP